MAKRIFFQIILGVYVMAAVLSLNGCRHTEAVEDKLNLAEGLMETSPDSSLVILEGIEDSELLGKKIRARYALLKSMALDKNYIDTTTLDILQPAIDFYLKKGNADECLRTLYYKGRIHRNAGEDDLAMQSYMEALELEGQITDSLTLARVLVAQGTLFFIQYRINDFIDNNIKAGELYGKIGKHKHQLRSYAKALDAASRILDKKKADSLAFLCKSMVDDLSAVDPRDLQALLEYVITFGDNNETEEIVAQISDGAFEYLGISLARAYAKIGEAKIALNSLVSVTIAPDDILDSLTYCLVATDIYEKLGRDKDALESHKNYSRLLEQYHTRLFSNELLFSEKKHEMVIESMAKIQKRDRIIKWTVVGAAILMLLAILIYFRYRLNKAARLLAEENAERLKLETEKLQLEAKNLELENEKFKLETDNLHLQVSQLGEEKDRLESLLKKQILLSDDARQLIRERIEMLNGLFAKAITKEENYGKEFQKYVEKIKKDKKKFQQSIGKVLEGTHPEFMAYLREHGLTEREMDYVCLYAIGLRGKEIGSYLDLARHYNISTDIRRKLGLDSKGENLGPFIRRMMDKEDR